MEEKSVLHEISEKIVTENPSHMGDSAENENLIKIKKEVQYVNQKEVTNKEESLATTKLCRCSEGNMQIQRTPSSSRTQNSKSEL